MDLLHAPLLDLGAGQALHQEAQVKQGIMLELGRDSLLASLRSTAFLRELAGGVLRSLARLQGKIGRSLR